MKIKFRNTIFVSAVVFITAIVMLLLFRIWYIQLCDSVFAQQYRYETLQAKNRLNNETLKLTAFLEVVLSSDIKNITSNESNLAYYQSADVVQNALIAYFNKIRNKKTGSTYFWVAKPEPPYEIIATSYDNSYIGKYIVDFEMFPVSSKKRSINEDLTKILRRTGEGFILYQHEYKNYSDSLIQRIIHISMHKPSGWIVAAGEDLTAFFNLKKQQQEVKAKINAVFFFLIALSILIVLIIGAITYILSRRFSFMMQIFEERIELLSNGKTPQKITHISRVSELHKTTQHLNKLIDSFKHYTEFIRSILIGNLDSQIYAGKTNNEILLKLNQLRKNLKESEEDIQKRTQEDAQRNWISEGLAKFATLLRDSTQNTNNAARSIIENLVNYLGADIGAIYLLEKDENKNKYLEMKSCFAYSRQKMANKKIPTNEGLTGRVFNEGKTLLINNVPNDYLYITSGLGKSNPKSILLVPLNYNYQTFGVIEIGALEIFTNTQISFVEQVAESISAFFTMIFINSKTQNLLKKSEKQKDLMIAKEKELRETIRKLKNVQLKANKSQKAAIAFKNAINHTFIHADINLLGEIIYVNSHFLHHFDYQSQDIANKHFAYFIHNDNLKEFDEMFQRIASGGKHFEGNMKFKARRNNLKMISTFTAIRDNNNKIKNILFLGIMPQHND